MMRESLTAEATPHDDDLVLMPRLLCTDATLAGGGELAGTRDERLLPVGGWGMMVW